MSRPTKNTLNTPQTIQTLLVKPESTLWDGSEYIIRNLMRMTSYYIIQTNSYYVKTWGLKGLKEFRAHDQISFQQNTLKTTISTT